jgi:hypothetical protein
MTRAPAMSSFARSAPDKPRGRARERLARGSGENAESRAAPTRWRSPLKIPERF